MIQFVEVDLQIHRSIFAELNIEYFTWMNRKIKKIYNKTLEENFNSIKAYIQEGLDDLIHHPPTGIFYLVKYEDEFAAIGGLRMLKKEICEIKRMYVKPKFRRKGIGAAIINQLLKKAIDFGFSKVRLDTTEFMVSAYNLYSDAGFYEINAYPESEGLDMQSLGLKIIFMEKDLKADQSSLSKI
ncbi:MAG: GNAT family N-acetyltransferase [Candidatus Kariarchaeaceae archaeon]|jgi:GNAT superfamily N-acetyltransferase